MSDRIVPVPAVNGVLLNAEGRVLLTRRSPTIREPGKWCLPGGHLEKGESWETALVRELREEIGIEVDEMDLLGIYGDPTLTMTDRPIAQGYRARFIVACFLVRSFRGQISADPKEVDAWDWFSPDTLPEPMIRSHPVRVRDAVRYRGEVFVR